MSEVSAVKKHNIILEERSKLSISGVTDVESFDENEISLYTTLGELSVKGKCRVMSNPWSTATRTALKSRRYGAK